MEREAEKKSLTPRTKVGRLINWIYSGKHPQQKYYKGLYNANDEREALLEAERMKRDKDEE